MKPASYRRACTAARSPIPPRVCRIKQVIGMDHSGCSNIAPSFPVVVSSRAS